MCLSEHPFGTVKLQHEAHYFLCKRTKNVTAEMGLSFLAYNMIRAINKSNKYYRSAEDNRGNMTSVSFKFMQK